MVILKFIKKITDNKIEDRVTKTQAENIVSSKIERTEDKWEATFEKLWGI